MSTLATLRTEIQLRLRDVTGRVMTAASTDILINTALEEWVNETEEIRQENAFALTNSQFDYAAPSDLIKILSAWYGPTRQDVRAMGHNEFRDFGGAWGMVSVPRVLTVEGQNAAYRFRLWPAPSVTSGTTTISGNITSSVTTIPVAAVTNFRSPSGWILIGSEKILYQTLDSTNFLLCRRGMGGTTAASHTSGDTVTQMDLHVWYARKAATLSADGDIPEIDARWHRALVYKALALAMVLEGRHQEAQANEATYMSYLHDAKVNLRRAQAQSPAQMRTYY